jgi:hypothetical protein
LVATANFTIVASSTPTNSASTNSATFVKTDTTTKGSWKNVYGKQGYNIITNTASYPTYATVTPAGKADWTWSSSTTDVNGLQKPTGTDRILALWYSDTSFTIDVNITDGNAHQLGLYFTDWDNLGRAETVEILDGNTGAVLNSQNLASFQSGRYLIWKISGKVKVRITRTAGPNAILNGLFFDAAPTQTGKTLASPGLASVSPNQFRLQMTGNVGDTFVMERSSNLVNWTAISTNVLTSTNQAFVDANATGQFFFYRAVPQ